MVLEEVKILVSLGSGGAYRSFIESKSFSELNKENGYEMNYLMIKNSSKFDLPGMIQIQSPGNPKRMKWREFFSFLSMKRFSSRAHTFPLKFDWVFWKKSSLKRKIVSIVFSKPFLYEFSVKILEVFLGTIKEVDDVLTNTAPDLVIIISAGTNDSFATDVLKSCKHHGIKNLMIMYNWDNVSCKGVMPILPDHFGTWGEQTKKFAMQIHTLKEEQVHVLGAPHFQQYYEDSGISEQAFEKEAGIKYILFPGSARYHSDIDHLMFLESEIIKHSKKWKIVYRPHPWKEFAQDE